MPSEPLKIIKSIDENIRSGQGRTARAQLKQLDPTGFSEDALVKVASLARRCNLPAVSLKMLHGRVRVSQTASEREIAEYAAALTYIGASDEALGLLAKLSPVKNPEVGLFTAFAHFSQWNYRAPIFILQNYIAAPGLDDYQRMVGQVNLAAALTYERMHPQATALLEELLERSTDPSYSLLRGNILELAAQNAIHQRLWNTGEHLLFEAKGLLRGAGGLFELFVRKWLSVLALMQNPTGATELSDLRKLRSEAKDRKHWETVRDCAHYEALCRKDVPLAQHVYFGTPYKSYRKRLLLEFDNQLPIPEAYFLNFFPASVPSEVIDVAAGTVARDVDQGEILTLEDRITPGEPFHRLLVALTSDFYSPPRLPALSAKVFPGEPFHPKNSGARTYQVILKLRQWLEKHQVPITVEEYSGYYRLTSEAALAMKILP